MRVAGYPEFADASAIVSVAASLSSKTTVASLRSKSTVTALTPGTDAIAFLTVIGQSAQVIFSIVNVPVRSAANTPDVEARKAAARRTFRMGSATQGNEINGECGDHKNYANPQDRFGYGSRLWFCAQGTGQAHFWFAPIGMPEPRTEECERRA